LFYALPSLCGQTQEKLFTEFSSPVSGASYQRRHGDISQKSEYPGSRYGEGSSVFNQPSKFAEYKGLVNSYLASFLKRHGTGAGRAQPQSLYDPVHYALEGNGKRLRPVLLLMCCTAQGGEAQKALPAAAAVELMHNFTLVHDDIMDRDDTRRGRPTVHRKWGTDVAILAGDALVVLAYKSLLETDSPHLPELCRLFTDGIIEICEGQALDRDFEQDDGVNLQRYQTMILKKTARLLAICAQMGARLGGATERQAEIFKLFAEHVGLAFQIQDDLLDITVDQAILGKDFGSDVRRHKRTFLYVHANEHGQARQRRELQNIFMNAAVSDGEILAAQHIFRATGALAAAEEAVQHHMKCAHARLAELGRLANAEEFYSLMEMLLQRRA
jgi:geranylgeranyl diphosphate synthase type II